MVVPALGATATGGVHGDGQFCAGSGDDVDGPHECRDGFYGGVGDVRDAAAFGGDVQKLHHSGGVGDADGAFFEFGVDAFRQKRLYLGVYTLRDSKPAIYE